MIFTMGGGAPEGGLQTCQICIAVALAAGPDTGKPLVFQGVFMGLGHLQGKVANARQFVHHVLNDKGHFWMLSCHGDGTDYQESLSLG